MSVNVFMCTLIVALPFHHPDRYCRDNPDVFKTADSAYVLAYAIIMLNTDAHNPVVTNKMSKAAFVRINASVEGEEGAPVDLLESIYDSIVSDEIQLKDDDSGAAAGGGGSKRGGAAAGSGGGGSSADAGQLIAILNLTAPSRRSSAEMKAVRKGGREGMEGWSEWVTE